MVGVFKLVAAIKRNKPVVAYNKAFTWSLPVFLYLIQNLLLFVFRQGLL